MLQVALESSRDAAQTWSVPQASQLAPSHPAWQVSQAAFAPCSHTAIPAHSNRCQYSEGLASCFPGCITPAGR